MNDERNDGRENHTDRANGTDDGTGVEIGVGDDAETKNGVRGVASIADKVGAAPLTSGTAPNTVSNMARLRVAVIAALCAIVVVVAGVMGWDMGDRSVDVRASAAYQSKTRELKRAETALTESKQDIDNRTKQVDEANGALADTTKEMERHQDLVKEFGSVTGDENPRITVKAIGPAQSSYGYHPISITIHNDSATTLTYYEIRYQLTDDAGNITHAHYINGTDACAANADCVLTGYDRFDPSGMTFTPISWSINGTGSGTYGRYGTDVVTRRL